MNKRDPFEAFRQSVDQERVFPFQEEDWEDLEQRLEASSLVPKVSPSPWWLLTLLLPIIGLLFSLHSRGQQQYAINHQLLSEIEHLRSEMSVQPQATTIIKHDTIVLERVVYRDHPARNIEAIQPNNFVSGSNTFPAFYALPATKLSRLQQPASTFQSVAATSAFAFFAAKENTATLSLMEMATDQTLTQKSTKQLAVYPLPHNAIAKLPLKSNFLKGLPDVHPTFSPLRKMGLFKRPLIRSVDLTLVAGGSIAAKPPQANLLSVPLDARLNARLGHGWMVFAGLAARISIYELDNPVSSLGIPSVAPPAEGYVFKELQVDEVSNWWLLGVGWELPSRNRWRPFLEISYRKSSSHVSELAYAFNRSDGPEIISEIDATLTPRPQDRIIGGAGLWYVPKRSTIQLGLGGTWSVPLRKDLLNQPRLGINARLGVAF